MADNNIVIPGSIGYFLIKGNIITEEQLAEALEIQAQEKGLLGQILVDKGFCTEADVSRAIEQKTGCKYVSIEEIGVNFAIANMVPIEYSVKKGVLPLYEEEGRLYVAMKNPNDVVTRDNLSVLTGGMEIVPVIVTDTELDAALDTILNNVNVDEFEDADEVEQDALESLDNDLDEKPAVQLVNQVITNAVRSGASDIHFEPMEKTLRVRLRIDGVLHEIMSQPVKLHASVASRVKVIGGMDIAERRIPQDGRTTVKVDERTFDIRIAVLPSVMAKKSLCVFSNVVQNLFNLKILTSLKTKKRSS